MALFRLAKAWNQASTATRGASFRAKVLRGVAWTTVGFVGSQAMRLLSNLLMTRLLAPEHFGVMALVTVVLVGLAMFSDIGLGPGVIRSQKIGDPHFLNTAWTLQIARGALLMLVACILAYPAAQFYKEPLLTQCIPVAALGVLISSFSPMQLYTRQRDIAVGKLIAIDLFSQASSLLCMVLAGMLFKSIWILVLGGLVGNVVRTTAQWLTLSPHRHRLTFDREHVRELLRFGGWIFFATVLAFASNSASTLILGKMVSMEKLGLFAIAATLARAAEQLYEQIGNKILYPLYSNYLSLGLNDIRRHIFKVRSGIVAAFVPAMCIAALAAEPIFSLLFDHRYGQAAWIFQIVIMGLVPSVITSTVHYLVAKGNSSLVTWFCATRLAAFAVLVYAGHRIHGEDGAIIGMALVPLVVYVCDLAVQKTHGLADLRIDAVALLVWLSTASYLWGHHLA